MKELNFRITPEEANIILAGLGKLPFETVYELITKLQTQAKEQLQLTNTENKKITLEEKPLHSKQALS